MIYQIHSDPNWIPDHTSGYRSFGTSHEYNAGPRQHALRRERWYLKFAACEHVHGIHIEPPIRSRYSNRPGDSLTVPATPARSAAQVSPTSSQSSGN